MAFYDDVHSTRKYRLLTRKRAADGREFIYLKGVTSTAAGSAVSYDEDGVTALVDTDTAATVIGPMAIAMAAVDASTEYGWYGIFGEFTCKAADAVADNASVFATNAAGVLDDAATNTGKVVGAIWRSINDSVAGTATIQISYPVMTTDVS